MLPGCSCAAGWAAERWLSGDSMSYAGCRRPTCPLLLEEALGYVWRQAAETELVVPPGTRGVPRTGASKVRATHAVVATSARELHSAARVEPRRCPAWAEAVIITFELFLQELVDWTPLALSILCGFRSGSFWGTFNYGLYNTDEPDIGKADAQRREGAEAGLVERFSEHVLGIIKPTVRAGRRPRYETLRVQPGRCLRFLPAERRAIRMLAPAANECSDSKKAGNAAACKGALLVLKGRHDQYKVPQGGWDRGWLLAPLEVITRAVAAYKAAFVTVGTTGFQLDCPPSAWRSRWPGRCPRAGRPNRRSSMSSTFAASRSRNAWRSRATWTTFSCAPRCSAPTA